MGIGFHVESRAFEVSMGQTQKTKSFLLHGTAELSDHGSLGKSLRISFFYTDTHVHTYLTPERALFKPQTLNVSGGVRTHSN